MFQTRSGYFDPESLARMDAALDEACRTLPSNQQTPEMRSALAKAIVHLATRGDRDPVTLSRNTRIATEVEAPFRIGPPLT